MSKNTRQNELFAGEDWTSIFKAFTQINFNSYDPQSINSALREYLQTNYPEDFNDWIESSEFVAIIDLLSWLAGSLAFRTDVNARENFLDAAQAKESVLRLARFLSYNPRRAQSSRGLVKITDIKTTESIFDSFGINLNNRVIRWNDPDNSDWLEQFTIALNSAMPVTNQYGIPLKQAYLSGANTDLYRLNNKENLNCVFKFNAAIEGTNEEFEIVNLDFASKQGFNERDPNSGNSFHLVYRNDGRGNASTRTGFFMMFKQGSLNQELFSIENPVENRVLPISRNNISETDVWVQNINDYGQILSQWTKVPSIFGENITFSDISPNIRNIFSVITQDNDNVSLRFGDGRFGNVPVGNLKVWSRVVNGKQYSIKPRDMENISIAIPYLDISGRDQVLTVNFSLQETVSNSVKSEDIQQIKARAPQVYSTQNRMVSGSDYNTFPLSNNEIVKLRAVNRVYSGHSRYIDINDPTSTFQDTVVFADDGIMYREHIKQYIQVPLSANLTTLQIITNKIQPMISNISVANLMQSYFSNSEEFYDPTFPTDYTTDNLIWEPQSSSGFSSVGSVLLLPNLITNAHTYLVTGCKIKFKWTIGEKSQYLWAKANRIVASTDLINTLLITIDDVVPVNARIIQIIPAFRDSLSSQLLLERLDNGEPPVFNNQQGVETSEIKQLQYFISDKLPFSLYYRHDVNSTVIYSGKVLTGQWIAQSPSDLPPPHSILLVVGSFVNSQFWSLETVEGLRYIFESENKVRWQNLSNHKTLDGTTGFDRRDTITILWRNGWDASVQKSIKFDIVDSVYESDGYLDPRKIIVIPSDTDDDGESDDPLAFQRVVSGNQWTIYQIDLNSQFKTRQPLTHIKFLPSYQPNQFIAGYNPGDVYFTVQDKTFRKYTDSSWVRATVESTQSRGVWEDYQDGYSAVSESENNLKFQWKHYADTNVRIDPAPTNIIDVFVLTSEYDFLVRQWIKEGAVADQIPKPPSALDLDIAFNDFKQYKMFSDEIIWRPIKYKYLFGASAKPELQAQFKVIRLLNSRLSDGEIRSKIVQVINNYFDVNKWEFGETFYFTELAAFIHMQLASSIASIVIVPLLDSSTFGNLFEVRSSTDEMFISTAQVSDIILIDGNSMANLRIK